MTHQAEYDTIVLDGMAFKAAGGIQIQNLAVFQRKFVIGDYTRDSHPLLSSWVITDLSGGHGIQQLEEGSDAARYRWGVINTRKPRQMVLPPLVTKVAGSAAAFPLGDLAGVFYALIGDTIYSWDEDAGAMVTTGDTLAAGVITRPTEFLGKLYLPMGAAGWASYNGSTVATGATPLVVDFCVMGESMLALATNGQLWQTVDGTTWTDLGAGAKIPAGTPRHLVAYVDRSGVPAPYIVTDMDVWACDLAGPSLYRTDLQYPRHRDQGLGATPWRGDLYTSVGMGVFRYNGDVLSALGLDRDQGLPAEVRGKIIDLCNEYNGMWAMVQAAGTAAGDLDEIWEFDTFEDDFYVNQSSSRASLHEWTGFGWHCMWESPEPDGDPTWIMVSSTDDHYRIWWGMGDNLYTIDLPIDFANARAVIDSGDGSFAEDGYLFMGDFDAGMPNFMKIANALRVRTRYTTDTETVRCTYVCTCDPNPTEVELGIITSPGDTVFYFGNIDTDTEQGVGSPFREIELRFYFSRGADATKSPLVESAALTFLKVLPGSLSWTAQLDLSAPFMGNNSDAMNAKLDELLLSTRFVTLWHRDQAYRVRLAMINGSDAPGWGDERSMRTVNILELRADL